MSWPARNSGQRGGRRDLRGDVRGIVVDATIEERFSSRKTLGEEAVLASLGMTVMR